MTEAAESRWLGRPPHSTFAGGEALEFMLCHVDLCAFESGADRREQEPDAAADDEYSGDEAEESTPAAKPRYEAARALFRLVGVTEQGHSVYVGVLGFLPYFYVEVPSTPRRWRRYEVTQFRDALWAQFSYERDGVLRKTRKAAGLASCESLERKKLYGTASRTASCASL